MKEYQAIRSHPFSLSKYSTVHVSAVVDLREDKPPPVQSVGKRVA